MKSIYPLLILLVEDRPSRADLFRQALARRQNPANVLVVRDGKEARACLLNQGRFALCPRPDVVLVAVDPEQSDARMLVRSMGRSRRLQDVLTVVLDREGTDASTERLHQRGAALVLPRPVEVEEYAAIVDRIQASWRTPPGWPEVPWRSPAPAPAPAPARRLTSP